MEGIQIDTIKIERDENPRSEQQTQPAEAYAIKTEEVHIYSEFPAEDTASTSAFASCATLKCHLCKPAAIYSDEKYLEQHLIACHKSQDSYYCKECNTFVFGVASLNQHLSLHDHVNTEEFEDQPVHCRRSARISKQEIHCTNKCICFVCHAVLKGKDSLKEHLLAEHRIDESASRFESPLHAIDRNNIRNNTSIGKATKDTEDDLTSNTTISCTSDQSNSIADLSVYTDKNRKRYYKTVINVHKCYLCNDEAILESKDLLIEHLNTFHSSLDNLSCDQCSYRTPKLWIFNHHLSRHDTVRRPYKCRVCTLRFTRISGALEHEVNAHNINNRRKKSENTCSKCGLVFFGQAKLQQHESDVNCTAKKIKTVGKACGSTTRITTRRNISRRLKRAKHASYQRRFNLPEGSLPRFDPPLNVIDRNSVQCNISIGNAIEHTEDDLTSSTTISCTSEQYDSIEENITHPELIIKGEPDNYDLADFESHRDTPNLSNRVLESRDAENPSNHYYCVEYDISCMTEEEHEQHQPLHNTKPPSTEDNLTHPELDIEGNVCLQSSTLKREREEQKATDRDVKNKRKLHKKRNIHKCNLCHEGATFESKDLLIQHLQTFHLTKKKLCCNKCSYTTRRLYNFNRHQLRHDVAQKPFECSACTLRFLGLRGVLEHEITVHNINNRRASSRIVCLKCGKGFFSNNKLKLHEGRVHSTVKKVKTKLAIKREREKHEIENKKKLHEIRRKPIAATSTYKCYLCNEAVTFKSKDLLKEHLDTIHSSLLNLSCDQCSYITLTVWWLNVHLSRHDAIIRPFKCTFCALRFTKPNGVLEHETQVHNINNGRSKSENTCSNCGWVFSNKHALKRHQAGGYCTVKRVKTVRKTNQTRRKNHDAGKQLTRNHRSRENLPHFDPPLNVIDRNSIRCNISIGHTFEDAEDDLTSSTTISCRSEQYDSIEDNISYPELDIKNQLDDYNLADFETCDTSNLCNGILESKDALQELLPTEEFEISCTTEEEHKQYQSLHNQTPPSTEEKLSHLELDIERNVCQTSTKSVREGKRHKAGNKKQLHKKESDPVDATGSTEEKPSHPELDIQRNVCQTSTKSIREGKRHKAKNKKQRHKKNATKFFKCYLCNDGIVLESRNLLIQHLNAVHFSLRNLSCEQCSYKTNRLFCLNYHLSRHDAAKRPFKCSVCPLRFVRLSGALEHEVYIHNINNKRVVAGNTCSKCDKVFFSKTRLMQHKADVHGIVGIVKTVPTAKRYSCTICKMRFKFENTAQGHEYKVHRIPHSRYPCITCGYKFFYRCEMLRHAAAVHGKVNLDTVKYSQKCYLCDEVTSFKDNISLRQHLRTTHQSEKMYSCNECDFSTPRKLVFNKHQARHDASLRPLKCSVCPLRYVRAEHKLNHEFEVHGIRDPRDRKKYPCPTCGKNFIRKDKLKSHERGHMRDNPE